LSIASISFLKLISSYVRQFYFSVAKERGWSQRETEGHCIRLSSEYTTDHSWALADYSATGASGRSDDDDGKNDGLKWKLAESVH